MNDVIFAVAAASLAWALTGLVFHWRTRSNRLIEPTTRGMHAIAVPAGGGLAIIATLATLWPLAAWPLTTPQLIILACAIGLSLVSWIDDNRPLWPLTRLIVQAITVAIALTSVGFDQRLMTSGPLWLEPWLIGLAWIWMINLYNFMDGIDGLAGGQTVAISAGVVVLAVLTRHIDSDLHLAMILVGASVGYLVWNWHPARIFMGDCGSIPLGFLVGWLMLTLAHRGQWVAALILPLYFIVDATSTLIGRLVRGQAPWQPHREHAYQRAVLAGHAPDTIVRRIMFANALLIALAIASLTKPLPALALAACVVVALQLSFRLARRLPSLAATAEVDDTPAAPPPSHDAR
jgi:UDP-N-acetylmuramyl pentapeptide phosphotransferase/UDP-N-acetylglucosamine-1-phosphate transferase